MAYVSNLPSYSHLRTGIVHDTPIWMNYMIQSWMDYPLGNSHIPSKIMFEDDVPFDQVGYVDSLEGIYIYNTRRPQLTLFNLVVKR